MFAYVLGSAIAALFVAVIVGYWIAGFLSVARRERTMVVAHTRARRAHVAALEAAVAGDEIFAPDLIVRLVSGLVLLASRSWGTAQNTLVAERPDSRLLAAWAGSRQAWLGQRLRVGRPRIDVLGVVNRGSEHEDRVIVRVRLRVRCGRPRTGYAGRRHVRLDERWTLARARCGWVVISVDGDPLAGPLLDSPLIAGPADDTGRLLEESLRQLAAQQTVDQQVRLDDLISTDEPPSLALLDLSVLDGRFLPPLVGATLRRLLQVWEEAVDGSEKPLEELASVAARDRLLRPQIGERLVMHDAVMESWRPITLELGKEPPAINVELVVRVVRYLVDASGAERPGSNHRPTTIRLQWRLELTGSDVEPWRLGGSSCPAESIPGWQP